MSQNVAKNRGSRISKQIREEAALDDSRKTIRGDDLRHWLLVIKDTV